MRCLAAALLLVAACAPPSRIPTEGRESLVRSVARQPRHLRVAAYVAPFFGDPSRLLLSDRMPAEFALRVAGPEGPLPAPTPLRTLIPGTPVFIDTLQFPTGAPGWGRPAGTPRESPWLLVTVEGETRPAVVVLSGETTRPEDLVAEIDRLLSPEDPSTTFADLPEPVRDAIRARSPVEGMHRDAVAMAWGFPDRIATDRATRLEEWSWAGGKRRAVFQDDRLVRLEGGKTTPKSRPGDGTR